MQRTPVTSSQITFLGYEDGVLEVEFNGGAVYRYSGILEDTYRELLAADADPERSVGREFRRIKDGGYKYERVDVEAKCE